MLKTLKLVGFILLCQFAGIAGSFFTISAIPIWYAGLIKPFFSPPNWLFGPVWTVLYSLMGLSAYLVWEKRGRNKKSREAITFFAIQLLLNAIWTPIFFGARNLFLAFVVIVVLLYYIFRTISAFAKISKTASLLLWPYALWVGFASILNFSIWILNR
jgi:benzodiazapine receptor